MRKKKSRLENGPSKKEGKASGDNRANNPPKGKSVKKEK